MQVSSRHHTPDSRTQETPFLQNPNPSTVGLSRMQSHNRDQSYEAGPVRSDEVLQENLAFKHSRTAKGIRGCNLLPVGDPLGRCVQEEEHRASYARPHFASDADASSLFLHGYPACLNLAAIAGAGLNPCGTLAARICIMVWNASREPSSPR